ncbi:hypothetical protein CLAFUW4_06568 [Fulvia fulva]|uniref:non-specific serine/threonine protein kinase n=1 Tax=Passalora fulva TaxID=5499 RepID=A0A9Q8UR13_PASFU|nr:uncharacterized protein CLAFUR5_06714 [Fulvia fulva]KAK4621796.1 hypothetical protein CLAFUR4_06576 [Fulvia fulva]KAK4623070.1 hypothetical protein CLAFUR0_06572 [Fulvia fulva]UJO19329.1 hypothetical protein CLAFUR5_06714 [Fulvia fulva]WPV15875.1 hypothetical protein CLAFUW4_06568 [Fulvia fulva]WPV31345.1 hypothetical protein CLAFUW7_06567 [Fulvia fulva]
MICLFGIHNALFNLPKDQITEFRYPNEVDIVCHTLRLHPNIVNIAGVRPDRLEPGRYRVIMGYCSGGSLWEAIDWWSTKRRSPIPEPFLLHAFVQMAGALAFIHFGYRSRGDGTYYQDACHRPVSHGDVKEDNFFLRWTDTPTGGMPEIDLGDLGIAKLAGNRNARLGAGTWEYHAPEDVQIYGQHKYTWENGRIFWKAVNSRSVAMDVCSMGQIWYKMAAREHPCWPIGKDPAEIRISREYKDPAHTLMLRNSDLS